MTDRGSPAERRAQRARVDALTPLVRRVVAGKLRRRARAGRDIAQEIDDVVQEALLAIFVEAGGALATWDPELGLDVPGFVAFVTSREVDSILRSRRRNPWTCDPVLVSVLDRGPAAGAGVETLSGSRHMLVAVAARLRARLSAQSFVLFEMLFLEGRAPEEVASALGLRVPAVHTAKSRLRGAARDPRGARARDGDPRSAKDLAGRSRSAARRSPRPLEQIATEPSCAGAPPGASGAEIARPGR